MSSHAIAHHRADMLRLSESGNRTELIAKAYVAGILEPSPPATAQYREVLSAGAPAMARSSLKNSDTGDAGDTWPMQSESAGFIRGE
jgi:hypothetical protein